MNHSHAEFVFVFKALSDETRLKILSSLSNEEICACDVLENLSITQPTLSYHMKMLSDSGLVNSRKNGSWMKYTLNPERLAELKCYIDGLQVAADGEQIQMVCDC